MKKLHVLFIFAAILFFGSSCTRYIYVDSGCYGGHQQSAQQCSNAGYGYQPQPVLGQTQMSTTDFWQVTDPAVLKNFMTQQLFYNASYGFYITQDRSLWVNAYNNQLALAQQRGGYLQLTPSNFKCQDGTVVVMYPALVDPGTGRTYQSWN